MKKIIYLVHGLGGDPKNTWAELDTIIRTDKDLNYEVSSFEFRSPSPLNPLNWLKRAPSISKLSESLITELDKKFELPTDEIILVGHSLGGLIIKQTLIKLHMKKQKHNISKAIFVDVPHDGSGYANLGKCFALRNRHLAELTRDSDSLDGLNDAWTLTKLDQTFKILSVIASNDDIVSSSSSKSIFRNQPVETIPNTNHVNISKITSPESTTYLTIKEFILEQKRINSFQNNATRNLNEWKRIDRDHSHSYVSDGEREKCFQSLLKAFSDDKQIVRLNGASGLGKTRLILEVFKKLEIDVSDVLICDAAEYNLEIKELIREVVKSGINGIIIIENCEVNLHNTLVNELRNPSCMLKIVTIGYSNAQVNESIVIDLPLLSDDAIFKILESKLTGMKENEVRRIANFAEGYPLLATLIVDQYQKEKKLLGSIEDSSVIRKLIGDEPNEDFRDLLMACSLFDVFGVGDGEANVEASFITQKVAEKSQMQFDKMIHHYISKQIINRAGSYARVVPKPLAVTLAEEWWKTASYDRQKVLIEEIPDSLLNSFCVQAKYLDNLKNVKRFSERLFGPTSPFSRAEVMFTEKGSSLFRLFVEVNPEVTSFVLHNILEQTDNTRILNINGNIRRNLIWGLEKLCFHGNLFIVSTWSVLRFALAENENFSNNSTGLLNQLFSYQLSGTEAKPEEKVRFIKQALSKNNKEIDILISNAMKSALQTSGHSRVINAEYQGTKTTLEEWHPKTWGEIFSYWDKIFENLLIIYSRGEEQKYNVMHIIGSSIETLLRIGRVDMLDNAITFIVKDNGPYWPEAYADLKYYSENQNEEKNDIQLQYLEKWLELLSPSKMPLQDKLKLLVVNSQKRNYIQVGEQYIDLAETKAKELGKELAETPDLILPLLDILQSETQTYTESFGYELGRHVNEPAKFIKYILDSYSQIEKANPIFLSGFFGGLNSRDHSVWQECLSIVKKTHIELFPILIRTGKIKQEHLNTLSKFVSLRQLTAKEINYLSYGCVLKTLDKNAIADFCVSISKTDDEMAWAALNIFFAYTLRNEEGLLTVSSMIEELVLNVSIGKAHSFPIADMYHWSFLVDRLINEKSTDFCVKLIDKILKEISNDFNNNNIKEYIYPNLAKIIELHGKILWRTVSQHIENAVGIDKYLIQQLLGRSNRFKNNTVSIISLFDLDDVINWCHKHPDIGPIFVASCLHIFDESEKKRTPSVIFVRLLEEFGNDSAVLSEITANLGTKSWFGSQIPYLEKDRDDLSCLIHNTNPNVMSWIKKYTEYINNQIIMERELEEEERIRGI